MHDDATASLSSDDALVVRARTDREAFGRLYDQYYSMLYGYCVRRLVDRSNAEDLCSETFLRAARKMPSFPGTTHADFKRWLYRIATNEINGHIRRTGRRKALLSRAIEHGSIQMPAVTNPDQSIATADWPVLHRAILQMNVRDQSLIMLRYAEEMSIDEIAEVLELRPGTVRVALSRALASLRERLAWDEDKTKT